MHQYFEISLIIIFDSFDFSRFIQQCLRIPNILLISSSFSLFTLKHIFLLLPSQRFLPLYLRVSLACITCFNHRYISRDGWKMFVAALIPKFFAFHKTACDLCSYIILWLFRLIQWHGGLDSGSVDFRVSLRLFVFDTFIRITTIII